VWTILSQDVIERLVVSDPTGAVIAAWEQLVIVLRTQAAMRGMSQKLTKRLQANGLFLAEQLGLPADIVGTISSLQNLRNEVGRTGTTITSSGALDYVQAVRRILTTLVPAVP
jgi:hypothetical protein